MVRARNQRKVKFFMDKETAVIINNVISKSEAKDDNGDLYFRVPLECIKSLQNLLEAKGFEYEEPQGI